MIRNEIPTSELGTIIDKARITLALCDHRLLTDLEATPQTRTGLRMVAMGGATKNADDLVKSLTRQYNRARQNQITRELADIVGAAVAVE